MLVIALDPMPVLDELRARGVRVSLGWPAGLEREPAVVVIGGTLDGDDLAGALAPLVEGVASAPTAPTVEPVVLPVPYGGPAADGWCWATSGEALDLALRRADAARGSGSLHRALATVRPGERVLLDDVVVRTVPGVLPTGGEPTRAPVGPPPVSLRWAIRTAVGHQQHREGWGDLHFARSLADALRRRGQRVSIDYRETAGRPSAAADDVVVVLRGLERLDPPPGARSILWVISHPELVHADELRAYDRVFAAGPRWARRASASSGVPIDVLLQCTDSRMFAPGDSDQSGEGVLFVANARGVRRHLLDHALAAGIDVELHGRGWPAVDPGIPVASTYVPNSELAARYRHARVVLNDHWPEMAEGGFVSNRLFDAAACGARVLSDAVVADPGDATLADLFGPCVVVAEDAAGVRAAIDGNWGEWPARAAVAARVRREHSFDARAEVLLHAALS